MNHLRKSDLRRVLPFITDCYKLRDFNDFAQHVVNALANLIPAEHITYNEMDPQQETSHNHVNTPELASSEAACLWEQHMHEHPVLAHIVRTGDCRAVRISDFWSQRQLRARGLYSDFYRNVGIEDALCFNLSYQPPQVVGIGLHRTRRFTDRERAIADFVRPHIVQAWQNAKLVSETRCQLQLANQGMESLGSAVIVCSEECQVQFISALARCHIAEYFGVSQDVGRLMPEELLRWVSHQNAQLSNCDAPSARRPLVMERGKKRLTIRLLSNSGANLLLLQEEVTTSDVAVLERLGLTRREAEVLTWVAQGKTNGDIGSILGMNRSTVKKHLEHVFLKLGVETRTAAAALAFEVCTENRVREFSRRKPD